ncbi:MAG: hypothetical protein ACLFSC_06425 [Wenzhouxiangella sp.]
MSEPIEIISNGRLSCRRAAQVTLAVLSAIVLAGCAIGEREPIYLDSAEVDPIRAPAGLDQPPVRGTYRVGGYFLPEMAGQSEDRPPRVLSSAEAEASRSHIRFGERGLYLEVEDELDSVWRRLGFSLDRAGMTLLRSDSGERRYAFDFDHDPIIVDRTGLARLAFWQGRERIDYSGRFVVEVQPDGDSATRVILLDDNGQLVDMVRAEYVLSVLRERLG